LAKRTASNDILAEFFSAWRLWLLGALLGALAAGLVFQIAPPDYRAQATVVVDNNLEEAWQYFPDRQLFQFLQRETERLEQLAWSDEVIQGLAAEHSAYTAEQLRQDVLHLSHPSDGGWHFYASAADPAAAQALASAWAERFVAAAQAAVQQAPELEAARAALSEALQASAEPDPAELRPLLENLAGLAEHTKGISIYTELYVSQAAGLPTTRSVSLATYLLAGSVAGALAAPLYVLLRPVARPRKR
jgi:capsular polysaccharide biosynthesis protein